jgi:hypothetical protein
MRVFDPNMDTALRWANELGLPPALPSSLELVTQRAKLVCDINTEAFAAALFADYSGNLNVEDKEKQLRTISRLSKPYMPDVNDEEVRQNISLRLWSGCLAAAKTIALRTMAGPNTPEVREQASRHLDTVAQADSVFCAGVEAAPSFKRLLREDFSFEGVPDESRVRRNA